MSHATVLVITSAQPTEKVLAAAMQPFHEFECTGVDDQYVIDVDETDKLKADYEKYGKGEPFDTWAEEWSNVEKRADGRWYRHTNPNARWDWYVVGGRWQGMLQVRKGAVDTGVGRVGLGGSKYGEGVDSCQRKDLDLEAMYAVAVAHRRETIDKALAEVGGTEAELEAAIRELAKANEAWKVLPDPKPRGAEYSEWLATNHPKALIANQAFPWSASEIGAGSIVEWVAAAPAFQTYAVVKDGKWHERGKMGWFGMSSDEKPDADWAEEFGKMIKDLDPEAYVTVVDYHI